MFDVQIPVAGMVGDQQAALFGQACFEPGMAKSTYGTGCFMLLNTGGEAVGSHNRLLTTPAYQLGGKTTYSLEGSIFVAGAAVKWLRDGIGVIASAAETEGLATQVPDDHGVYMVPAFVGLGAPYWDPDARGAIFGLTLDATVAHLTRAALEAVAYQSFDLAEAMAADGAAKPDALRVDGGMTANSWLCQFLADILHCPVERPATLETTALGAAFHAGLATGLVDGSRCPLADLGAAGFVRCRHGRRPPREADRRLENSGRAGADEVTCGGCPARIRTSIDGFRVRSLTIRRRGKKLSGAR